MARAEHVVDQERVRIAALKHAGLTLQEIAARVGRSRTTVWRALKHRPREFIACPENHTAKALAFLSALETETAKNELGLETRRSSGEGHTEGSEMTSAAIVQEKFIEPLAGHFSLRRRNTERFIGDLTMALVEENFAPEALERAARTIVLNRKQTSFPSVALSREICREAANAIATEGVLDGSSASPGLTRMRTKGLAESTGSEPAAHQSSVGSIRADDEGIAA